jgi:uncharacterized protein
VKAVVLALVLAGGSACDREAAIPPRGPEFPALTGRVVDQADLLDPASEASLVGKLAAVERDFGPQFVVVTVPTLQGYPIEDYGVQLGRHWGIGHKERNDGVLLIVAPSERKVRIEVGYGLERRVTDPFAAKVIREAALPRFREGDLGDGIEATSDAIIARLRSPKSEAQIAREDGLVL